MISLDDPTSVVRKVAKRTHLPAGFKAVENIVNLRKNY